MKVVYISLGSNLGSRILNCLKALKELEKKGIKIKKLSRWYLTEPFEVSQPWFINAMAEILTYHTPSDLLKITLAIEKSFKRIKRDTPRMIDIDLILFKNEIIKLPDLIIPHPKFRDRRFVLEPLAEINPQAKDPITGLTAEELLRQCKTKEIVIPLCTTVDLRMLESFPLNQKLSLEILPRAFFGHL